MPKKNRSQGDSSGTQRQGQREATVNEMLAAGKIPLGPEGQSAGPIKVQIVKGDSDFLESLREVFGQGGAMPQASTDQLRAVLSSQEAMTQAAKEITSELKAATAMMRDLQVRHTETITKMTEQTSRERTASQQQLDQLIQVLSTGGIGSGPSGVGVGYRGIGEDRQSYYNPASQHFVSYGGMSSRLHAKAANYLHNNFGTPSLGRHATDEDKARASTMSRIAGGVASGGMGAALRRVPYVGMAIGAAEDVDKAATWLTDQRAQNAQYQAILGGSNSSMDNRGNPVTSLGGLVGDLGQFFQGQDSSSTSGLGNRMAEEGYVLGQRFSSGGFDEQTSRQLFQGVTSLGYTGDRRSNALQFAQSNYDTMGMSAQDSLQIMGTMAKYAQSSFAGLTDELRKVSTTAVQTGQSAQVMRQQFTANLGTALQASQGTGSPVLAGAVANMTGAGGRLLNGANPLSVLNDRTAQYTMAGAVGMTPSQLEAAGQTDPGLTLQAMGARSNMFMKSLGTGTLSALTNLMNQRGGAQKVAGDQGLQADVATDLMRSSGYDITVARNIVSQIDPSMANASDQAIAQYIVNYQSGNNPTNQAAIVRGQNQIKPISPAEFDRKTTPTGDKKYTSGMSDYAGTLSQKGYQMMSDAGPISNLFGGTQTKMGETLQINADYYNQMTKQAGHNDPVIEKLLNQFGTDRNIRFKVKTKDGDKAVTFGEAIRYFPDQLSNGSAVIMSSNKDINNRQVKDIAGSTGYQPKPGSPEDSSQRSWSGSDPNTVAGDIGASTPDQSAGQNTGGGQITLSLSPEAAALFNVQTSGNVNLNSAADAGRPVPQTTGPK